ncbi:TPA: N-acetylmuramoyl-L-alanine amidase [Escherichia coli]
MAYKIFLDPGHGGKDPGAVANGLKEKDITLEISKMIRQYLLDNYTNIEVRLSREFDAFLDLSDRAEKANTWGADIFISVHINAGGGTGFESFRHPNASDKTSSIQTIIHREVANFFKDKGFIDRGIKTANYAVLRETKMAAVLLENLFIDNPRDAAFLKEEANRQAIAEAIGKGIVQAFGLKQTSKEGQTEMTKTKILFEGKELEGFIVDGKSYAEVRKLCELLGLKVTWNAQKGIVEVSK